MLNLLWGQLLLQRIEYRRKQGKKLIGKNYHLLSKAHHSVPRFLPAFKPCAGYATNESANSNRNRRQQIPYEGD